MAPEIEITLKQLAQIALGAPEITEVNIAVLHSLFDVLLKKMNCESEKVTINGFDSTCLEQMLANSRISAFPFNDEKVVSISDKLQRLSELQHRTNMVEQKLGDHFHKIRECHKKLWKKDLFYVNVHYPKYAHSCEDLNLHELCEPQNQLGSQLIRNARLLAVIMRLIVKPLMQRIIELEAEIEALKREFQEFVQNTAKKYEKIILIEPCMYKVENMSGQMTDIENKFLDAMREVQDMLISKLDSVHLPPLKRHVEERIKEFEAQLNQLERIPKCPRTTPVLVKEHCLACSAPKDYAKEKCLVQSEVTCKKPKEIPKGCGCSNLTAELTLLQRIENLNLQAIENALDVAKREYSYYEKKPVKMSNSISTLQTRNSQAKIQFEMSYI